MVIFSKLQSSPGWRGFNLEFLRKQQLPWLQRQSWKDYKGLFVSSKTSPGYLKSEFEQNMACFHRNCAARKHFADLSGASHAGVLTFQVLLPSAGSSQKLPARNVSKLWPTQSLSPSRGPLFSARLKRGRTSDTTKNTYRKMMHKLHGALPQADFLQQNCCTCDVGQSIGCFFIIGLHIVLCHYSNEAALTARSQCFMPSVSSKVPLCAWTMILNRPMVHAT